MGYEYKSGAELEITLRGKLEVLHGIDCCARIRDKHGFTHHVYLDTNEDGTPAGDIDVRVLESFMLGTVVRSARGNYYRLIHDVVAGERRWQIFGQGETLDYDAPERPLEVISKEKLWTAEPSQYPCSSYSWS